MGARCDKSKLESSQHDRVSEGHCNTMLILCEGDDAKFREAYACDRGALTEPLDCHQQNSMLS